MTAIKALLISDITADEAFASGYVLKKFFEFLPEGSSVSSIVIGNPRLSYPLGRAGLGEVFFTAKPQDRWKGTIWPQLAGLGQAFVSKVEIPRIVTWAQGILDAQKPDVIVYAAQCQVLSEIIRDLNFREAHTIGFMWDHPVWWARENGITGKSKDEFFKNWISIYENASSRALPSKEAGNLFTSNTSNQNVVTYPLFENLQQSQTNKKKRDSAIKLAFAGKAYAREELESALLALRKSGWRAVEREIELNTYTFGSDYLVDDQIINHGWLSPADVGQALEQFDIALLPYPGDVQISEVANYSFPSKLGLYTRAGLPIIYVGPPGTATLNFIEEFEIGRVATAETLVSTISEIYEKLESFRTRASRAYDVCFSETAWANTVQKLINLDDNYVRKQVTTPRVVQFDELFNAISHNQFPVEYWAKTSLSKYLYLVFAPVEHFRNRHLVSLFIGKQIGLFKKRLLALPFQVFWWLARKFFDRTSK